MSNPGSGSGQYNIQILDNNRSNYDNWKFRVSALLKIKCLMEIVRETEKCPPKKTTDLKDQVAVTVINIKWDYSYYQPWSDNEWLVDEMLAMLDKNITM